MKKFTFAIILVLLSLITFSQTHSKRDIYATRIDNPPKIDGILDDNCWSVAKPESDFYQLLPFNGEKPTQESLIRLVYNDHSLYVGAKLFDTAPDSIYRNLAPRDSWDGTNSDLFTVIIGPFNDGINMVEFMVSAAGVQSDGKHSGTQLDESWNAVWKSAVQITEEGWVVEMEIPYSELRIPKKNVQEWAFHAARQVERNKEWSTWNFINSEMQGFVNQAGSLKGIENVEHPVRLSLTPYTSAYVEHYTGSGWGNDFNIGMDLKYGINESFTIDMTLIPDFGQVESDDVVLNLSPFEIRYDENRPFFMEGTELFNRGNIFYSRRVGSTPKYYDEVYDDLGLNEEVILNPGQTNMINATKLSGRTNGGLGIGVFNAMTGESYAQIEDTLTGIVRDFRTQSFTNYNMFVLDQSLPNNSYISFANTLVNQFDDNYNAHVAAVDFGLRNKASSLLFNGNAALSTLYRPDNTPYLGHKFNLGFEKTKGKFLYEVFANVESDTYEPNDFGYISNNNEISYGSVFRYLIQEPFWILRDFRSTLVWDVEYLYNPREFSELDIEWNLGATIKKNHLSVGTNGSLNPIKSYNFFEPRVWGWFYEEPTSFRIGGWISSDYRKKIALDLRLNYQKMKSEFDQNVLYFTIEPRFRFNSKFLLIFELNNSMANNNIGYMRKEEISTDNYQITFGRRDFNTLTNSLRVQYTFTNKMSLNFRLRHYWSTVSYKDYYILQADGSLSEGLGYSVYGTDYDVNYNAFNIDLNFLWHYAPGSDLSIVWKNSIYTSDSDIAETYFTNLENVLQSNQINSFSVKLIYYLDYQNVRKLF